MRCCKLSRERKKNRRALVRNGFLAALVVTGIVLVSQWINLPNSLLPKTRITDFSYYAAEFSALFSALHDLAGQGGAAAENAVRYAESHVILAGVVVLTGILLSVGKSYSAHGGIRSVQSEAKACGMVNHAAFARKESGDRCVFKSAQIMLAFSCKSVYNI